MRKPRIIAIIPARGGSKGIPKKNIVDLAGKPLIQYTIEPALNLKKKGIIDEVIVSTDDLEIAEVSKNLGANVPFIRPKEISTDESKSIDLVIHALDFFKLKSIYFDYVVLLQPTSPLRTEDDIRGGLEKILSTGVESLISVYLEDHVNDLVAYNKEGEFGLPLNKNHNKGIRRQDVKKLYVRNGALYITKVEYLEKLKQIISDYPMIYEMPKSKSVDINSLEDLKFVRCFIDIYKWANKKECELIWKVEEYH